MWYYIFTSSNQEYQEYQEYDLCQLLAVFGKSFRHFWSSMHFNFVHFYLPF